MVAACRCAVMLPKRSSSVSHILKVALDIVIELVMKSVSVKQVKSEIITDKRVSKMYLGILSRILSVITEIIYHSLPKPRMTFGRCSVKEECVILAGFGPLARENELAVTTNGIVAIETAFCHRH